MWGCGIGGERDGEDCQTDEEGVSKVKGWHGGVLIAEFVLGPDASFAAVAVDGVYETVAACCFACGAFVGWV